jgi:hypothetical protein
MIPGAKRRSTKMATESQNDLRLKIPLFKWSLYKIVSQFFI